MLTDAAREIRLIQMGRSQLKLDDDTYRQMLANLCGGKTSSKALTAQERQRVLAHLKSRGFVIKRKGDGQTQDGWRRAPQMRKLRAIWYLLAERGEVDRPANAEACDAAIETWAKRQLPELDAIRFADGQQMSKLIEEIKAWGRRVGAPVQD